MRHINEKKSERENIIQTCESCKNDIERTTLRIERMSVLPPNNENGYDFMSNEVKFGENQTLLYSYHTSKQIIQLTHCLHLWNVFGYLIKVSNQEKWDANWLIKYAKPKLSKHYTTELSDGDRTNVQECVEYLFESQEIGDMQVFEFI